MTLYDRLGILPPSENPIVRRLAGKNLSGLNTRSLLIAGLSMAMMVAALGLVAVSIPEIDLNQMPVVVHVLAGLASAISTVTLVMLVVIVVLTPVGLALYTGIFGRYIKRSDLFALENITPLSQRDRFSAYIAACLIKILWLLYMLGGVTLGLTATALMLGVVSSLWMGTFGYFAVRPLLTIVQVVGYCVAAILGGMYLGIRLKDSLAALIAAPMLIGILMISTLILPFTCFVPALIVPYGLVFFFWKMGTTRV